MKHFKKIGILFLLAVFVLAFTACGESETTTQPDTSQSGENTPSGDANQSDNNEQSGGNTTPHQHSFVNSSVTTDPTYNFDGVRTYTCSCGVTKTETINALTPTQAAVANGIKVKQQENESNYNFSIALKGTVKVYGMSYSADSSYNGEYRYNKTTGELKFRYSTSGKLLSGNQGYVLAQGDQRIKVNVGSNGAIKKLAVVPASDDELNMLNLPFSSLINGLGETNIDVVTKTTASDGQSSFRFKTSMHFASDFAPIQKILGKIEALGSTLSIKNISFTNPQNGITLYFNISDDGVITGYTFSVDIKFPVESVSVTLKLSYTQNDSSTTVNIPSLNTFITNKTEIDSVLTQINAATNAVKNSDTYSLDLTALNKFDAGWNKKALTDKYTSRMYKNVNSGRTDFNHSFKYNAHTEEDGAEGFPYTVGNVQEDNKVWQIARKGTNSQTELSDTVNADSRFDIHTSLISFTQNDVDFLNKTTNGDGSVTYTLYTKDAKTTSMQQLIADLINSNTAEGTIDVENYFDSSSYEISTADFTITLKSGKLVSFNADIEMRYTPTDGPNVASKVTLTNTIELKVNENLDKASAYEAPNKVSTSGLKLGLNNNKFYIQ